MKRVVLAGAALLFALIVLPPLWYAVFPVDLPPELPAAGIRVEIAPGVALNTLQQGEGSPVVLVHGFTGSDASWFASIDHTIDDDVAPIDRSMVEQFLRIDGVSVFKADASAP
jgi:hypothetical protein